MGLFGPSKDEIWEEFSNEIKAKFIIGGFLKNSKVEFNINNWNITLDTYAVSNGKTSTTYTRIRAPFVNENNFKFKIYRAGIFSEIGKCFGIQDINIGYKDFDEEFIIKGNEENKIIELFSNDRIRSLIKSQPKILLEIKDDEGVFGTYFPQNVDELYFSVPGVIKDINMLKGLFDLFEVVLNELNDIGVTDKCKSNIEL
ncbi:DUF3137 domain-containing protein [Tepidibacter mesophilus]|uniref:DUF3137 domain-containing protein n=1 Tax=Tepidibacter mesophilus TaxID=655607 RepID=UPI000C07B321|nr:DUF3137 domain-containing protein [Tepidibacter mesophilus]